MCSRVRSTALLVLALLTIAPAGLPAHAATKVSFGQVSPTATLWPGFVATKKGFFAANGVEMDIVSIGVSPGMSALGADEPKIVGYRTSREICSDKEDADGRELADRIHDFGRHLRLAHQHLGERFHDLTPVPVCRFRSPHHFCRESEMRISELKPHWINKLLVSFDSEVRKRACSRMMRTSEAGH